MWQLYSLGSLVAGAFETVTDKAGIVRDGGVDSYAASFYRVSFFLLASILLGASGVLGPLDTFFHWSFLILAIMGTISTLMFTYLLRSVELTALGATAYLTPFLFLFIDTQFLDISFAPTQIIGIILLVCGGLAFSLDGKTHHFRRDLTWRVWSSIFFIYVFNSAVEVYLFKYLNVTHGLNAVSFYVYSTLPAVCILFAILVYKGRLRTLYNRAARTYIPYAALGKSFDAFNSILYITALSLATVSQVSAFNALMPLVLVIFAWVVQSVFGIRLKEHLDYHRLGWKIGAAIVLVVGGFLVA